MPKPKALSGTMAPRRSRKALPMEPKGPKKPQGPKARRATKATCPEAKLYRLLRRPGGILYATVSLGGSGFRVLGFKVLGF